MSISNTALQSTHPNVRIAALPYGDTPLITSIYSRSCHSALIDDFPLVARMRSLLAGVVRRVRLEKQTRFLNDRMLYCAVPRACREHANNVPGAFLDRLLIDLRTTPDRTYIDARSTLDQQLIDQ